MSWSVVYEKAIRDDGSLWFPKRLTREFLEEKRKLMGSYIYANQYQNEVIPKDKQTFKREWIKHYSIVPNECNTFCFIDPAIGQEKEHDFTGVLVVRVSPNNDWFVVLAKRFKVNPTELVELVFRVYLQYKPQIIGIEDVAYQKALLYMIDHESKKRSSHVPVMGIRPDNNKSKEMRILGLVPRFEFGRIFLSQGLEDLEDELLKFPRAKHDDLLDSLAYMDQIVIVPTTKRSTNVKLNPNDPGYEKEYIRNLHKRNEEDRGDGYSDF